jgi:branched-chain amino acid transport system ATP-binding protein
VALLEIQDLSVRYGSVPAIRSVNLDIEEGKIYAILGPNGAGKTTILKSIIGLMHPSAGSILFAGRELRRLAPHAVSRLGIGWVPEGRQVFATLTVNDNLLIGSFNESRSAVVQQRIEQMYNLFPILRDRSKQAAGSLSGGEQQMLAIARALMSGPKLLLMDEPSLGLAPLVIREMFQWVKDINIAGTTILMVEQNARQTFKIADWVYLLAQGAIVGSDTPAKMSVDAEVSRAYLGIEPGAASLASGS